MKKITKIRVTLPFLALLLAIAFTAFTPHAHHKAKPAFSGYYFGQVSGSTTAYNGEVITIGSQWHDYSSTVNGTYFNGDPVLFAETYCDYGFGATCVVAGSAPSGGQSTVSAVYQGQWGE